MRLTTTTQIGYHLKRGASATTTAERLGLSRSYVYRVASERSWPTNPSVVPESPREAQIVAASRIFTGIEMTEAFSMSPVFLNKVLRRVDTRTKLEFA